MKTFVPLTVLVLGLASVAGLAGVASSPVPAQAASAPTGQSVTPKLAPNVKPAPAYEAPTERLVAANPTPIFSDLTHTSPPTGELKLGESVQQLAKVPGWDWILVGKDGVGIGYVPRSLLKPVGS